MRDDQMQIGEVLIRYASGIDQRDWPLFRTCWTHDVVADYDTLGTFVGVDAITDAMTTAHQSMGPTYHRLSNFVIDVEGERASVRCYVHAILMVVPGDSANWVEAIGSYDDVFVRTDAGWRISRRTSRIARMLTAGDLATALASTSAPDTP